VIDLGRARLIAEAAGPLDDDGARAVEDLVLGGAGALTAGQLRVALHHHTPHLPRLTHPARGQNHSQQPAARHGRRHPSTRTRRHHQAPG